MIEHREESVLAYPQARVFEVVAAVERYPEFVPGLREARIVQRDGECLQVEQAIGLGPFVWRFGSAARLQAPAAVSVESREAPFRLFELEWRFAPEGPAACRTRVRLRMDLAARALQRPLGRFLRRAATPLLDLFGARLRSLEAGGVPCGGPGT